jgi:hypothetical protein
MVPMSIPSDIDADVRETLKHTAPGRVGVPGWALAMIIGASIAFLSLMEAVSGMAKLIVFIAGFVALGLAGWAWGCDSRDGGDWRREQGP